MSWAPWQLVQVGAAPLLVPFLPTITPWMLSWYLPATLPPGILPFLIVASLPWHAAQVASMFAWLVREVASAERLMSC
jgi:hypothetical protein